MKELDRGRKFLELVRRAVAITAVVASLGTGADARADTDTTNVSPAASLPTDLNSTIVYDPAASGLAVTTRSGGAKFGKNLRRGEILILQGTDVKVGGIRVTQPQGAIGITAVVGEDNDTYVNLALGPNTTTYETDERSTREDFPGIIEDGVNAALVQAERTGTKGNCGLPKGCDPREVLVVGAHHDRNGKTVFDLVEHRTFQR